MTELRGLSRLPVVPPVPDYVVAEDEETNVLTLLAGDQRSITTWDREEAELEENEATQESWEESEERPQVVKAHTILFDQADNYEGILPGNPPSDPSFALLTDSTTL